MIPLELGSKDEPNLLTLATFTQDIAINLYGRHLLLWGLMCPSNTAFCYGH